MRCIYDIQRRIHRGAGGLPPIGLQPPLEQGELEEEKVKGEEEKKKKKAASAPLWL